MKTSVIFMARRKNCRVSLGNLQVSAYVVGVTFSHLCTDLLEHCPLSEHRKDNAYQLVRCCEKSFFERLSLAPLLHIVGSEGGVMLDNAGRHQPDHPPEVPVAPL